MIGVRVNHPLEVSKGGPMIDQRVNQQIIVAGQGSKRVLSESFVPGSWDVICHAGKDNHNHIGNIRFRICVQNFLASYKNATSRAGRSAVITNIVSSIRESSGEGGFVRQDKHTGRWYEVGDKVARDKVGQSLRDVIQVAATTTNEDQHPHHQKSVKRKAPSPVSKALFERSGADPPVVEAMPNVFELPLTCSSLTPSNSLMGERFPIDCPTHMSDVRVSHVRQRTGGGPFPIVCPVPLYDVGVSHHKRVRTERALDKESLTTVGEDQKPFCCDAVATTSGGGGPFGFRPQSNRRVSIDSMELNLFDWFELDAREINAP